jgi:hypothetical protein
VRTDELAPRGTPGAAPDVGDTVEAQGSRRRVCGSSACVLPRERGDCVRRGAMTFEASSSLNRPSPTVFEARTQRTQTATRPAPSLGAYIHPPPGPRRPSPTSRIPAPVVASVLLAAIAAVAPPIPRDDGRRRRRPRRAEDHRFDGASSPVTWQALTFRRSGFARAPAGIAAGQGLVPVRGRSTSFGAATPVALIPLLVPAAGPRDRHRCGTGVERSQDARCRGVASGVTWRSI